jgi:hypothetical protein
MTTIRLHKRAESFTSVPAADAAALTDEGGGETAAMESAQVGDKRSSLPAPKKKL